MEIGHVSRVRVLYKTILRLHIGLPQDMKFLGDGYAREEFKRHKKCNMKEAQIFLEEWTKYASLLAEQLGLNGLKANQTFGKPIGEEQLSSMSDEQIYQLYELKLATEGKSPTDDDKQQETSR